MKSKSAVLQRSELKFDFRKAFWGMTKSDVKYSEVIPPNSEGENYVTYKERVMGLEAIVGFHFNDGQLVQAGYAFRESFEDEADYIKSYQKVKETLALIYGQPEVDEDLGEKMSICDKQSCTCDHSDNKDTIMFISEWLTERTIIRLILMGDNNGCDFGVLHIPRNCDAPV